MKLLVITPTLGRSEWLNDTVASVRRNAPGASHVLVAPPERGEELKAAFPDVVVRPERDRAGMYAAVNDAVAAESEWSAVAYLNDDDVLLPGFERVLRWAGAASGIVYGRVRLIDGRGRRLGAIAVSHFPRLNRSLYAQRLEPVAQQGTVFSRAVWQQLGGFDPEFRRCGDSELLARACVSGIPARYCAAEVAAFRLTAAQLSKDRAAMDLERRRVDEKLQLLRQPGRHERWARLVFRTSNLAVYAERVARHGFLSYDEMLARIG